MEGGGAVNPASQGTRWFDSTLPHQIKGWILGIGSLWIMRKQKYAHYVVSVKNFNYAVSTEER